MAEIVVLKKFKLLLFGRAVLLTSHVREGVRKLDNSVFLYLFSPQSCFYLQNLMLSNLMYFMHHVNNFNLASPCLDARDSDALWWALLTEHTPSSPPPQAQRTAQASQRMRMRRPLKAQRLWWRSTPRSPLSSPTCATSPATRLRSMLVTTPLTPHAAAWQRMSAPAQCLKVKSLIVLLFLLSLRRTEQSV